MAKNKIIYKEPSNYFNAEMKKAAKEWEASQKAAQKAAKKDTKKK